MKRASVGQHNFSQRLVRNSGVEEGSIIVAQAVVFVLAPLKAPTHVQCDEVAHGDAAYAPKRRATCVSGK